MVKMMNYIFIIIIIYELYGKASHMVHMDKKNDKYKFCELQVFSAMLGARY